MKKIINPALVYLETLAPSGRRSMKSQLRAALKVLRSRRSVDTYNWGSLCYADMIKIRSQLLEQNKSIHTVNLCLAALKGTAQCAFHLGILKAEELMHIKSVKRAPGRLEPTGRSLSSKELGILFRNCQKDKSITGIRDSALLAVMVTTGLRRSEVASLVIADYDHNARQLHVSRTKGNKDRVCKLPSATSMLLDKWINKRTEEKEPIFCRIRKNNNIELKPLSSQAVYNIVKARADEASLGKVRPHDLRRSFVTRLLESNVDINTVRQLVGHTDIKTTSRYDLRTPNARKLLESIISF
ncbi:MAG: tyrosine-type recombinase/integrase [Gammaproteobacteria bacterium]|nr:tyrosine-type recombinase/integrase [Gammaproteobacteria bacterium]